jgi:hypothetical protein
MRVAGAALWVAGLILAPLPTAMGAPGPITAYSMTTDGAWASAEGTTWQAQSFSTGSDAAALVSVTVHVRNANLSNSNASPSSYSLALYSASSGVPGSKITDLVTNQSVAAWGDGTSTYTSSQSLSASTTYFVVMTGSAGGTIGWKFHGSSPSTDITPAPSFTNLSSTDGGGSWTTNGGRSANMVVKMNLAPAAPTLNSLTAGNGTLTVAATLGSDNGSAITDVEYSVDGGGWTSSGQTTGSFTISGLANGTAVSVRVRAVSGVGASAASNALNGAPLGPPGSPTGVSAVAGNALADITWTAPTSNGGSAITGYTATASPGGLTCTTTTATTCRISTLTNGTAYTFSVVATNAQGNSAASAASAAVTPGTVPDRPRSVNASGGDASALVWWAVPASNGGAAITSYTVTSDPGGKTCTSTATSCNVASLTNGTSYRFSVVATNARGTSIPSISSPSVTPSRVPDAPDKVRVTAGNASIDVSWTAPASDGGDSISGYTATAQPSGRTCVTSATTCTITGLTNGADYTVTVYATNARGDSPRSAESASVTPAIPASPSPSVTGGSPTTSASAMPTTSGRPSSTQSASTQSSAPETSMDPGSRPAQPSTTNPAAPATAGVVPTASGSATPPGTTPSTPPAGVPIPDRLILEPVNPLLVDTPAGPVLQLTVDIAMDQPVAGRPATVEAVGLQPGSTVQATVYSEPQVIGTGTADAEGRAAFAALMPIDLPPGTHTIIASGTGPDGQPVQSVGAFTLGETGIVTALAPPNQVATPMSPGDPELTRALEAGKPLWDQSLFPAVTTTIALTVASVIGLAGAGGMTSFSVGREEDATRTRNIQIITKKLKSAGHDGVARGDASRTWRLPGTAMTDRWMRTWPNTVMRTSALASRVMLDGTWARAMFGSAGLFIPLLLGLVLGFISSASVGFQALPPALPLLIAIIGVGILDAAAGATAWLVIAACAALTGNLTTLSDLRTLIGMFALFASISLLAHVIRPLRRKPGVGAMAVFDRVADYVMPPVFLAFATTSLCKALNGLSGLQLSSPEDFGEIRVMVVVFFILRLAMEDVAAHLYPERSKAVQPAKIGQQDRRAAWISVVLRMGAFLLIAAPFFGIGWMTLLAAVLMAVPNALKIYEDDLPNSVWLNKWYPRGVARFIMVFVICIYLVAWLLGMDSSDSGTRQAFTIILVPGIISGVIELIAREGWDWPDTWLKRLAGFFVWAFAVCVVTGVIALTSTVAEVGAY